MLICRLFPDQLALSATMESENSGDVPMTLPEYRLAVVMIATIGLWLTESIHGIAPPWVGLAAATACLLPGLGVVGPDAYNAINHRTLLYVAALLGVVTVIAETGLGSSFAKLVLAVLPLHPGNDMWNFALLVLLSFSISLVASTNGVGAIYTSLAAGLAQATGLPLISVLMIQVLGFSTVAFAYQAPPIMVAVGLGKITPSSVARLGVRLTIATFLILMPLEFLWWRLIGMI
jgi:di/tricarboxylate transporter